MDVSPELMALAESLIKEQTTGRVHSETYVYPAPDADSPGTTPTNGLARLDENPALSDQAATPPETPRPIMTQDLVFDLPRKRFATSELVTTPIMDMTSESRIFVGSETVYTRSFMAMDPALEAMMDLFKKIGDGIKSTDGPGADQGPGSDDEDEGIAKPPADERWARLPLSQLFTVAEVEQLQAGISPSKIRDMISDERVDLLRFEPLDESTTLLEMMAPVAVLADYDPGMASRLAAPSGESARNADIHLIAEIDTLKRQVLRERDEISLPDGSRVEVQVRLYGFGALVSIEPPPPEQCYPAAPPMAASVKSIEPSSFEQELGLAVDGAKLVVHNMWPGSEMPSPDPLVLEAGDLLRLSDISWTKPGYKDIDGEEVEPRVISVHWFHGQRGDDELDGELLAFADWDSLPQSQNEKQKAKPDDPEQRSIVVRGKASVESAKILTDLVKLTLTDAEGNEVGLELRRTLLPPGFEIGSKTTLYRMWMLGQLVPARVEYMGQIIFDLRLTQLAE